MFRKLLDSGEAGDIGALLLKRTDGHFVNQAHTQSLNVVFIF